MNFVSCDVETTGTDSLRHDLLEVAMAVFNTNAERAEPFATWSCFVKKDSRLWEDSTLLFHLHNGKLEYFLDRKDGIEPERIGAEMEKFLVALNMTTTSAFFVPGRRQFPNVVGKNFAGFDHVFLRRLPGWKQLFDFRILDLGNLVCTQMDEKLPNLKDSLARCGIHDVVPHTALDDAILTGKAAWAAFKNLPPG